MKRSPLTIGILLGCAAIAGVAVPAQAGAVYIGEAIFDGSGTDKSGLAPGIPGQPGTRTLEDGVSPNNGLNGFGSGLAYAGDNLFYALADRGPNKVTYPNGSLVDNTTSYSNRYQQFQITLTPVGPLDNGKYDSYTVNATNVATTLLSNAQGLQYTGISTAFTNNTRLDSEAIRVAPDRTVWVSDEYGPFILHFDQKGHQIGSLALPPGFQIANPGPTAKYEAANNTTGRTTNRGAEGLAITPDGKTLVVMMQSSLTQDAGLAGRNDRVLVYDLTNPSAPPKQYLYQLDSTATPISELLAINNHQFLVDERDGNTGPNAIKKLYMIDLNQPNALTDLTNTPYSGTTAANGLPASTVPSGVTPLSKTPFADLGQILNAANPFSGVNGLNTLPDKIEGLAWGPDLPDGRHLLLVTNDNDFAFPGYPAPGYPNYIFAFAVDPSDVPGFQPEAFVPEPASLPMALFGLAAVGLLAWLKRCRA
jgi:hypothetical protein